MSDTIEEKLIELVRAFPCLWRPKADGYRDLIAKENAWKEVAKQVSDIIDAWMTIYFNHRNTLL